jgi:hypothetical protein
MSASIAPLLDEIRLLFYIQPTLGGHGGRFFVAVVCLCLRGASTTIQSEQAFYAFFARRINRLRHTKQEVFDILFFYKLARMQGSIPS